MKQVKTGFGDNWKAAFGQILGGCSSADGPTLFLEERRDAVVRLESRSDATTIECCRTAGLSIEGQSDGKVFLFQADPEPDDVPWLHRRWLGQGSGDRPAPAPSEPSFRAGMAPEQTARMAEELIVATKKLRTRADIAVNWVVFDQSVLVGRPGRESVEDVRRGSRLRLELSSGDSAAVAEQVLDPGRPATAVDLDSLVAKAATRLEERRSLGSLDSGEYPIVFAPGVGGVLIHELAGHALEADTVLDNASWLAPASSGETFSGSSELSVIDDPRRSRAAWRIDDEGVPARAVALMRHGQVAGWLHDRATSIRSGRDGGGHGRRASFREPVRPRMGCTFLAPGKFDSADALTGVERGIYVRRMEAARTDTRNGRAVFRVSDADCIRRGRTEGPLAPHLIVVDARDALSSIECVANDLAFDVCVGSCLHHGQPLAISVGGPTFRIGLTPVSF